MLQHSSRSRRLNDLCWEDYLTETYPDFVVWDNGDLWGVALHNGREANFELRLEVATLSFKYSRLCAPGDKLLVMVHIGHHVVQLLWRIPVQSKRLHQQVLHSRADFKCTSQCFTSSPTTRTPAFTFFQPALTPVSCTLCTPSSWHWWRQPGWWSCVWGGWQGKCAQAFLVPGLSWNSSVCGMEFLMNIQSRAREFLFVLSPFTLCFFRRNLFFFFLRYQAQSGWYCNDFFFFFTKKTSRSLTTRGQTFLRF